MEVYYHGRCFYLDGSGGRCESGYELAPQSVLSTIASDFGGKTYKNQTSDDCCIFHSDMVTENYGWRMPSSVCNAQGQFTAVPVQQSCTQTQSSRNQLTLCMLEKAVTGECFLEIKTSY